MLRALCELKPAEELFNLLNVFREWSGGKGEEKGQKHYTAH
jgi:hypothetical protein